MAVPLLENQHCNMEQYSMNELTDMHLVYGAAYQRETRAARIIDIIYVSVHNGY